MVRVVAGGGIADIQPCQHLIHAPLDLVRVIHTLGQQAVGQFLRDRVTQELVLRILKNQRHLVRQGLHFPGFGGFSKQDRYPCNRHTIID